MKDLIIGTAGHIDHGKTALVRALTGIDTDRLAEEKRRGITIDIGFAHLQLGNFRLGFIDVPGHEKFVKNMLAGIGGIHMLLFVIAADESVMPQTIEHFQICKLLGIRRGIIVLTKALLVDPEILGVVRQEVNELVAGSFLERAPVVAVDSLAGDGIDTLREAMLREIQALQQTELEERIEERVFQLPIDRVFTIRGFGTVVTGTAVSGSLRRDEQIRVLPGGFQSKARNIEIFGESAERADAGQRTALNLPGIAKTDLRRGMIVCPDDTLESQMTANVRLELLASSPSPLRHRMPLRFHHGSAETIARVYLLDQSELKPGQSGIAQLRLEEPAVLLPGERFIVRRYSPLITIGGGVILDNNPPHLRRRKLAPLLREYEALLAELEGGGPAAQRLLLTQRIRRAGLRGMTLAEMVAATGLKANVILGLIQDAAGIRLIEQDPVYALDLSTIESMAKELRTFLETYHQRNPLAPGMPREELRERFLAGVPVALVQFVLEELERRRIIEVRASHVGLAGSTIELSDQQKRLRERLLERLRQSPFQAPGPAALAKQLGEAVGPVRSLFYYLVESGEILRISEELTVLPEQFEELVERMRREFPEGRRFTVPEFKEILGLSRKYAIPVLEYLDRRRITRRMGDSRTLVRDAD